MNTDRTLPLPHNVRWFKCPAERGYGTNTRLQVYADGKWHNVPVYDDRTGETNVDPFDNS